MKKSDHKSVPAADLVNLLLVENAAQELTIAAQEKGIKLQGRLLLLSACSCVALAVFTSGAVRSPVVPVLIAPDGHVELLSR